MRRWISRPRSAAEFDIAEKRLPRTAASACDRHRARRRAGFDLPQRHGERARCACSTKKNPFTLEGLGMDGDGA